MATIIKKDDVDFQPNSGRIDGFRLMSDVSRIKKGIDPQYLNFDLRRLDPREYNAAYHFHRYAEELFVIMRGSSTLRTPRGIETVEEGDMIFFEAGENGAHQLYNHTDEPCIYLDLRSYIGHDVCEYPDSDKIIIVPGGETFRRSEQYPYFDGETDVEHIWEKLKKKMGHDTP